MIFLVVLNQSLAPNSYLFGTDGHFLDSLTNFHLLTRIMVVSTGANSAVNLTTFESLITLVHFIDIPLTFLKYFHFWSESQKRKPVSFSGSILTLKCIFSKMKHLIVLWLIDYSLMITLVDFLDIDLFENNNFLIRVTRELSVSILGTDRFLILLKSLAVSFFTLLSPNFMQICRKTNDSFWDLLTERQMDRHGRHRRTPSGKPGVRN